MRAPSETRSAVSDAPQLGRSEVIYHRGRTHPIEPFEGSRSCESNYANSVCLRLCGRLRAVRKTGGDGGGVVLVVLWKVEKEGFTPGLERDGWIEDTKSGTTPAGGRRRGVVVRLVVDTNDVPVSTRPSPACSAVDGTIPGLNSVKCLLKAAQSGNPACHRARRTPRCTTPESKKESSP